MIRKTISLVLAAALALLAVPVSAQTAYAPKTIWGAAPASLKPHVTSAVLKDASGVVVSSQPLVDGQFAFLDVPPGNYTVVLTNSTGTAMASSEVAVHPPEAVTQAIFPTDKAPGAIVSSQARGITTAGWIAIGAAAAGITTAIVAISKNDNGNASPSR